MSKLKHFRQRYLARGSARNININNNNNKTHTIPPNILRYLTRHPHNILRYLTIIIITINSTYIAHILSRITTYAVAHTYTHRQSHISQKENKSIHSRNCLKRQVFS